MTSNDETPPLVARPQSDFYAFVILVALCGVGMMATAFFTTGSSVQAGTLSQWGAVALVSALFGLPCLIMIWLMRRLCIVADARGLWFQGAFKKSFIAWQDVEDYELRPPLAAGHANLSWIKYRGQWKRLPLGYASQARLRARIQSAAKWSRAQEWQLSVERDEAHQWPKTYAYRDPSGHKALWGSVALVAFLVAILLGNAIANDGFSTARLTWENLDLWGRIGFAMMPLVALTIATLMTFPHYLVFRIKQRLGRHIIRADREAITLIDGSAQTRIAWPDVSDYFVEEVPGALTLHQAVVQSAEARLVFWHEIENLAELKALVKTKAVNAQSSDWRAREGADSDTLGGETTLWPSGIVGVGRKVYHYRTRTGRAMLALGATMLLVFVAGYAASLMRGRTPELSEGIAALIFLPIAALTLVGALAFWRASIQTDETGIYQRGIRGERDLKWDEIESFSFNGYFYTVKGTRTAIRYGLVAASEILRAEIEARSGAKLRHAGRPNDDE